MRARTWPRLLVLGMALLCALGAFAQQTRAKIPPPDFKREWEADAAGLRQWKAFDVPCVSCKGVKSQVCEHCKDTQFPLCLECDGKKHTTCRTCGGKGKMPDPLVDLACPYCSGSSWYTCEMCNGWGFMKIDSVDTKCGACKQKGLLKCQACNGQRRVETIKVAKKGVGEASAKDLTESLKKLHAAQDALEKFEPDSNPSRSQKAFAKALEPVERDLKAIKDMQKMLDDVLKGVNGFGAAYSGFVEHQTQQFLLFKDRTNYLLQHQIRAAEQSLERAEFNESK
ncbi:MAG: hypothetical protein ABIP42_02250 [Planctomycetota bacterium]